eukprot:5298965-Amphidinium_carterae.1
MQLLSSNYTSNFLLIGEFAIVMTIVATVFENLLMRLGGSLLGGKSTDRGSRSRLLVRIAMA